ncbi:MAG: TrkH family potassium uptake protein [Ruminococcaceae bacterium]|jgi:trk system potassium uptake protein TrkH|nr:TrkH family potassium uptake protein [Oscillospiraceae bacterium]
MNRKTVFFITGKIILAEAAMLMLPLLVSLVYHDGMTSEFLIAAALAAVIGFLLTRLRPEDQTMYAHEGFAIVALAWIALSAIGALPFCISGYIPSYIDSLFEVVSGFTTTGSSILTQVEALPRSLLFWRSFTHWVGGMGVLVFVMAVIPLSDRRSMHIMRAEVPGPIVGKLTPKLQDSAKILYTLYLILSAIQFVLLICGGMGPFDSAIHVFGTAGTGGFSSHGESIAFYHSAYIEWVITIFMALFGVNFNLYYYLLLKNYSAVFKNEELRWYLGIMVTSAVAIAINIMPQTGGFFTSLRYSAFQVSTVMTTTGYATTDFNLWPAFSKTILVTLMFIGASAGSTGGGLKVSRLLILAKSSKNEIRRMLHPRMVTAVTMDEKPIPESTVTGAFMYLALYVFLAVLSLLILSLDNFDLETTFTAMAACFNNIGPGLGVVGPTGNYSAFSDLSKIVLIFDMLLGRLEIFPLIFGLMLPSRRSITRALTRSGARK